MSGRTETAGQRTDIYAGLTVRNRVVGILRIGVPGLGVLVLVLLIGQIYLLGLARQFGIGSISISGNKVTVGTPSYSGVLADGSSYTVSAGAAEAEMNRIDVINLDGASVALSKPGGTSMSAKAETAALQTLTQTLSIKGVAQVANSTGTSGTLTDSMIDYPHRTLTTRGKVAFQLADGTTINADSMSYDVNSSVWRFTHVTLVLPMTPGDSP